MKKSLKKSKNFFQFQGPIPTSEMMDRQSKGLLSAEGVARRSGTNGHFNPVARIDFELYL